LGLKLGKKIFKCYTWSIALYGAETWAFRKVDLKYLERFKMWCCRRMEKMRWSDRVKNDEVLRRVKKDRNILNAIKKKED
jgi:hypothetical protein